MMRRAIPVLLTLAVMLPMAASGQFADETESLFQHTPEEDWAATGQFSIEFTTAPPEPATGTTGARSVEDICCGLPEAERAGQAICIDVELTCN